MSQIIVTEGLGVPVPVQLLITLIYELLFFFQFPLFLCLSFGKKSIVCIKLKIYIIEV